MCSAGTQLSLKTLQPHVKSRATQTETPKFKDVGVSTSASTFKQKCGIMTSTPLKRLYSGDIEEEITPIKKACLEKSEMEDPLEGSSTMNIATQEDPTYDPEDSISAYTEATQYIVNSSKSIHETLTYIVYENCLMELFEECPVCQRKTSIWTRIIGTLLSVEQHCPHCDFFRKWNSQPVLPGGTPAGNLQLSVSIFANGGSFFKVSKVINVQ